jgi:hypothetical protein
VNVIGKDPAIKGAPESTPLFESNSIPFGRVPLLIDQVNGGSPPDATMEFKYDSPYLACGKDIVIMMRGSTTVNVRFFLDMDRTASATVNTIKYVPVVDEEPEITAVLGSNVIPVGRAPATVHLNGGTPPTDDSVME